ncbi:MAG: tetratricopeptide repeat protein [Gammaproteobacteria bacterium]
MPEPLRSAVTHHEAGRLKEAYPLYRQFVAANPEHPTALQLFGLLLSRLRQYAPAIELMRESLRLFPDQPEVANNLGNALFRSDQVEEALASYARALELRPDYLEARRNLGLSYAKLARFEEGLAEFSRCVELAPEDAPSWFALGNLRREAGDLEGAVAAFEMAIELQPDYADAHHNLGVCLRLLHEPEQALVHYERARELGLDRAELHHNIGNALADLQRDEEAIAAYTASLERNPYSPDTNRNLNSLLWQQDRLDDYLGSYRRALTSEPGAEALRIAYATSLSQHDRWSEAEEALREGLVRREDAAGNAAELKSRLAYTLEGQGRWEEALDMHAGAVAAADSQPNHRVSYGRALLACRRPEEALEQIQSAAVSMPFNQRVLAYLGLCWRLLGDPRDDVLNDYENLVRVYDLPTPAGYRDTPEFNDRLKAVLGPLHVARQHPAEQTLRSGSQTRGNLFDRREPEIVALQASLRECIADYIGRFPDDRNHPLFARRSRDFEFSASWSVKLRRSGYHTVHTHPLGWISSAYYVNVPDVVSESDAYGGGIKFGEPDIDIGEAGEARRRIQPATGRLVLFPSYMWHGTEPFEADEPRMTVAFDVVPRD